METTNTIKGIEVIAYKGMKSNMTCKGFHYEIGKSYKTDKAKLCECGFHACLNPRDVLDYYSQDDSSRYFKVKLYGEITKCTSYDTNVAAIEITILEEINIDEIIKTTEWWKNENILGLLYWSDGFTKVQREDRLYNFIDKKVNMLSNEWYKWVDDFHDGLAKVQRGDDLWNFIDKDGNYLSKEWFEKAYYLDYGLGIVQKANGEWCKIDRTGTVIKIQ